MSMDGVRRQLSVSREGTSEDGRRRGDGAVVLVVSVLRSFFVSIVVMLLASAGRTQRKMPNLQCTYTLHCLLAACLLLA